MPATAGGSRRHITLYPFAPAVETPSAGVSFERERSVANLFMRAVSSQAHFAARSSRLSHRKILVLVRIVRRLFLPVAFAASGVPAQAQETLSSPPAGLASLGNFSKSRFDLREVPPDGRGRMMRLIFR
jgi:hypothetical protein